MSNVTQIIRGAGTVKARRPMPNRIENDRLRTRKHLLQDEVDQLMAIARKARKGVRDSLMIHMAYRHGLRVSELVDLQWSDIDMQNGQLSVRRLKGSLDSTHPMDSHTLRQIRKIKAASGGRYVFTIDGVAPITTAAFRKMLARVGVKTQIVFPVNPHMLRHGTGFALANKGVDTRAIQGYLGHVDIQNTVRYTQLSGDRFKDIWDT